MISGCDFAKAFWEKLGFDLPPDTTGMASKLHNIQRPAATPQKHLSTFVALCCWHLWKRRNGVIFRSECANLRQTMIARVSEVKLWKLAWCFHSSVAIGSYVSNVLQICKKDVIFDLLLT
jgi:hypothetical protein